MAPDSTRFLDRRDLEGKKSFNFDTFMWAKYDHLFLVDTRIAGPTVSVCGCDWITARIAFHDRPECLRLFFLHPKFSSQPLKSVFSPSSEKHILFKNVGLHSCYLHAFLIVDDIDLCGSTKNLLTSDMYSPPTISWAL